MKLPSRPDSASRTPLRGHPGARIRVAVLLEVQSTSALEVQSTSVVGTPTTEREVPAADLLRLQRDSYAIEAALIGDDRIPALHETVQDLARTGLRWLVTLDTRAARDGTITGAIGYTLQSGVLDIDRLVVDPVHHRRGIGRLLVTSVLQQARSATVATGRDNAPARGLYENLGFAHIGDREVIESLWVSDYRWTATAS